MKNYKLLLELFLTFFKVSMFTFGGGYAMLPLLTKEVVERKKWATNDEILNYYAIGQCTPGIIAVNTSTFIGYKYLGIFGAFFATLGFIAPSVIIILSIANILTLFLNNSLIAHAFAGIRIAVVALISTTAIKMVEKLKKHSYIYALFIFSFIASCFFNVSPLIITLVSVVFGVIFLKKYE